MFIELFLMICGRIKITIACGMGLLCIMKNWRGKECLRVPKFYVFAKKKESG